MEFPTVRESFEIFKKRVFTAAQLLAGGRRHKLLIKIGFYGGYAKAMADLKELTADKTKPPEDLQKDIIDGWVGECQEVLVLRSSASRSRRQSPPTPAR